MPERPLHSRRHRRRFVVETVLTRRLASTEVSQQAQISTMGCPASVAHVHNFAETETAKPRPSTQHCSVENETTKAPVTTQPNLLATLIEAIDRSERFDGTGFFARRKDQRLEMTGTAYALLQALRAGGDAAIKFAIDRFPRGLRQRAPSASKPALLAIQLTAKPRTTEERKACSSYASLLIVAQALGITIEGYRAWANGIDLADAEVQAKKIRAALTATASDVIEVDQLPTPPVYELQVAILVDGKPKEAVRVVIQEDQTGEFRAAIARAGAEGDLKDLAAKFADLRQNEDRGR